MTRTHAPALARTAGRFTQLAIALAASAVLAACGGGEATAPDTTAPSVTITSSAAGSTATGAVTFTFNFSEEVGTSFTAEDIVVNGGTAGAFTMVSATQATLVVTPAASATGTLSVSVAASKFVDAANNPNSAAASLEQAYNTMPPAAVGGSTGTCTAAPCVGFGEAALKLVGFGALGAELVADPMDATNKVAKLTKVAASETWAGATIDPAGDGTRIVPAFDFATSKVVTLRVLSPAAGELIMLKVENGSNDAVFLTAQATTTKANEWETLTFNYATPAAGTYDAAAVYNRVSVFPHFDTRVTADTVFHVDELKYAAVAATGGGGGGTATGSVVMSFDEATAPGLIDFGTNGAGASLVADPAGGANKVLKVMKYTASEQWAGTTVATVNVNAAGAANAGFNAIPRIPFTESAKTMTLRVYSPAVGVRVRLKVENANNNAVSVETDAVTTTANAWETLTFDFNNPGKSPPVTGGATSPLNVANTYDKVSIFADFGIGNGGSGPLPADRVYYFDDLRFGSAAASGGGSGGGASGSPVVFASGYTQGGATGQGGTWGYFSGDFANYANTFTGGGFADSSPPVADASQYFYLAITTTAPTAPGTSPVTSGGYLGMYVTYPGAGVSVAGKTNLLVNLGVDANFFAQATNKAITVFVVGAQEYDNGAGGKCKVSITTNITPTTADMITYTVPLSSFTLAQGCTGGGFTANVTSVAQALAQNIGAVNTQLNFPNLNTTVNSGTAGAPVYATGLTRGKTEFQ